jgi:uncharacterized protein
VEIAGTRVALIIGNSNYQSISALQNPANDAALIAEKLWEAGFEVIESIDADRETMLADLATFKSRLREGSEAIFFYAGHGVQIDGKNYLLPISVAPTNIDELRSQSVEAQLFVDAMSNSGAKLNMVLLDACRNNPFAVLGAEETELIASRAFTLGTAAEDLETGLDALADAARGGLAEMAAGRNETLISFATAPGEIAFDGAGLNSPYTQSIAEHIDEPGLEIGDLFRRVRGSVRELTGGLQITWTASTLENQFYFKPPGENLRAATTGMGVESDTLGALPPRRIVDRTFWRAIRDTDRVDAFTAYLRTQPGGAFVQEAREKIRNIGGDPDSVLEEEPGLPVLPSRGLTAELAEAASRSNAEALKRADHAVAIGVGGDWLPARQEGSGWVFLPESPKLGTLSLGDRPVSGGSVQYIRPGEQLAYNPIVGSNGGVDEVQLVQLQPDGTTDTAEVAVETFVHACDMLAGNPYDSARVTAGTRQFILDRNFDAAIVACELAVSEYPDVVRYWAQLARSYRAAGRYDEALEWQMRAVEADYVSAFIYLGQMYLDAQAVPRDYARAIELFQRAADRGETAAFTALAWVYRAGVGVEKDEARALEYYREGARRGNDWAMTNIGEMYHQGIGVEKDAQQGVHWYEAAARSGELTAQTRLARIFQQGDGVPQDAARARTWFETAAGRGVPNALTRLGIMYEEGQGTSPDVEAAARLYIRAAYEGDGEAFFRLGRLYASGNPLYDDPARGAVLLERAVEENAYGAARELGRLSEMGTGVPKDIGRARELYVLEAEGNPWAARDAGRVFESADGVAPDHATAARWYRKAVEGGVPWAALDLARLTEAGLGVPTDRVRALVWYAAASAMSDDVNLEARVTGASAGYTDAELVAAAQTLLAEMGHDVGTPDGQLGQRTLGALQTAYAERGMQVPGGGISMTILADLYAMK